MERHNERRSPLIWRENPSLEKKMEKYSGIPLYVPTVLASPLYKYTFQMPKKYEFLKFGME